MAVKRTCSYSTCRVAHGEEINKNKHYLKLQISHSLPPCPLYFTRRCYWKSSVEKGLYSTKTFFCCCSFWCVAELLYDDGAEVAQRLFALCGHMVLAH